ncbi:MAG TPA: hypothetical protein VFW25_02085 [Silvibacterium sp.]|nr:hypothetical protein [Silvibacterium sp.]
MRKFMLLMCAFGVSCATFAQTNRGSWENLGKVTPGQKIQIFEITEQKHSGTFVSVSDSAISFTDAAGSESVPRQNVKSVKLLNSSHRLLHGLIGAGMGAGAGGGIAAAAWEPHGFAGGKGTGAAVGAVIGGVSGLIVGVLLPSHDTIYRVSSH